jgi:hypothetical protein
MTLERGADLARPIDAGWVDEVLLAGPADQVCFSVPAAVHRGTLRERVAPRRCGYRRPSATSRICSRSGSWARRRYCWITG